MINPGKTPVKFNTPVKAIYVPVWSVSDSRGLYNVVKERIHWFNNWVFWDKKTVFQQSWIHYHSQRVLESSVDFCIYDVQENIAAAVRRRLILSKRVAGEDLLSMFNVSPSVNNFTELYGTIIWSAYNWPGRETTSKCCSWSEKAKKLEEGLFLRLV